MAPSIEQGGYQELQWDLARLQRNPQNMDAAFALSIQLSPTAVSPAVWMFDQSGVVTSGACIFKLTFSTDTALYWQLYNPAANIAPAGVGGFHLGNTSVASGVVIRSGVLAAPGVSSLIDSGYASAGSYTSIILPPNIFKMEFTGKLCLATPAVAANCSATFWWAEPGD